MSIYAGQVVPIPLGRAGLTGSEDMAGMSPEQLVEANNISYWNGAIEREGGHRIYHGDGTDANFGRLPPQMFVFGGYDWWPTLTTQRMVVYLADAILGGCLFWDTGTGWMSNQIPFKSGLSITAAPVFVSGGRETASDPRKLFVFTGANPVQVITGDVAAAADIALPPSDWASSGQPITGVMHEGRLWAAAGHRIWYSNVDDHEDFTTADVTGTLGVYSSVGERIVAMLSYKQHALVIFKDPFGIFVLDTSDVDRANWVVHVVSTSLGCAGPQAVVSIEGDVLFLDYDLNFQLLSGIQEFGQLGTRNISDLHRFSQYIDKHINRDRRYYAKAVYYAYKREVHVGLSSTGAGYNNMRVVLDFSVPQGPKFRTSTMNFAEGLWMRRDGYGQRLRPVCGGWMSPIPTETYSCVFLMDYDDPTGSTPTYNIETWGYVSSLTTPPVDLGAPTERKSGAFLHVVANATFGGMLYADILWDGKYIETVALDVAQRSNVLGQMILGQDALAEAVKTVRTLATRITGSGYRLAVRFWSNAPMQGFSLSAAYLSFQPSDRHIQQGVR